MSHLTGMSLTLSGWKREREGSYACKKQAEIRVEHGELFQMAELTAAVPKQVKPV